MPRGRDSNGRYVKIDDDSGAVIKVKNIRLLILFFIIVIVPWVYIFNNFWDSSSVVQAFSLGLEILNWFKATKMAKKDPTPV